MLTSEQRETIEEVYREMSESAEVGICSGIRFVLNTIGESNFSEYLKEKY